MLTRPRTPDQAAHYEEGYADGFADAVDDVTPGLIEAAKVLLAADGTDAWGAGLEAWEALAAAVAVAEGKR